MTREEAINEIKSWAILSEKGREVLETLIPELKESEDERIRKALIDGVRQIRCKNGITQEQMLTWLEKQKEQKPVDYEAELKKCKDNPLYFYDKYVSIKPKPVEWSEEDLDLSSVLQGFIPEIMGKYGMPDTERGAITETAYHFYKLGIRAYCGDYIRLNHDYKGNSRFAFPDPVQFHRDRQFYP